MYHVCWSQVAASFFFLSNFQHWNFLSHFSQELWGLEDWNVVYTWTMGRCIMCTGIRLLLLIRPYISWLFFLSNFQHWNFSSHFSRELWGLEVWKLVDSEQMYHVYQNQAAAAYLSLYFFIFLSLQFSTLKFFITLFSRPVRPRRVKLCTHIDSGQMYRVYRNHATAAYLSLYFFIFLSLQLSNIKNFRHIFLRNCAV